MSAPEFSIVIPTRNGTRYLAAAIESVLAQRYPHWRLHVLESGSTDGTVALVERYLSDPRIALHSTPADQPSLDIVGNWARILQLDLSEYLTILGHDDLLSADFLAEIAELIAAEPSASLWLTHFDLIDSGGALIRPCKPFPPRLSADEYLHGLHTRCFESYATGYVMRSSDYKRLGGIPPLRNLLYADLLLWYRLTSLSYLACSPRRAFSYRVHGQSMSYAMQLSDWYTASEEYLQALADSEHFKNPVYRRAAYACVAHELKRAFYRSLLTLIQDGTVEDWRAFRQVEAEIAARAARAGITGYHDWRSRLLRLIAALPSRTLRRALALPIQFWRARRAKRSARRAQADQSHLPAAGRL
ncbi:MAG: glycosyltransferase [Anaerolineae bacterium]|nr:glycosyltransferase [Anaerolineae bacterium]